MGQSGSLTVVDSIFKNNKAIQVGTTNGGGAIALNTVTASSGVDLLVLSSVFELNEATSVGGALKLLDQNGALSDANFINNKELLFGNDANLCPFGAVTIPSTTCFFYKTMVPINFTDMKDIEQ